MPAKRKRDEAAEGQAGECSSSAAAADGPRYFLMKSEPDSRMEKGMDMKFSIDDLKESPDQTAEWDGVRNFQARNVMRGMKVGDKAFFYHSNCKVPGIVGIATIVREAYPDHTQFDEKNPHYDAKSKKEDPRWDMVDVKFERELERMISLEELKRYKEKELKDMHLFTRARLSVSPVSADEWSFILSLEKQPEPPKEKKKRKKKADKDDEEEDE
ncbi:unnamed protein product [Vitrella brassicaformis CCMP3155]|uniref:Thymocyte nuclear protein 1 n=1 Tax=Vitrella brassicaformis (strain CCMP3155) TaxID=1169540 RepID=A0A0G4EFY8_VITBC|nr:unnamed protein product [Vitrella brassicaformis CCMP3155]|mmetsp:Transcript_43146/g.107807  ORF Transcript_43146/g.107807 Transcript_43146/m.107807 type:complete len:214 (-) Transcript_43146:867-1508(-)|eukprot:CEL94408.1 unnamed protein product [Vitrella brassicaformis CCMP3155]